MDIAQEITKLYTYQSQTRTTSKGQLHIEEFNYGIPQFPFYLTLIVNQHSKEAIEYIAYNSDKNYLYNILFNISLNVLYC